MKIIVDVMGTELGALPILEAVRQYQTANPTLKFVFVGDEQNIRSILQTFEPALPAVNYEIKHASDVIEAEEGVLAIKRKPNASLVIAFQLLQQNYGHALISGGSTAHFVAASHLMIPKLPFVKKPGYMVFIPTIQDDKLTTVVDVGANLNNSAYDLFLYAFLARCFVKNIFQVPNPQLGVINIGSESSKGKLFQQEVYQLLKKQPELAFVGNVEPNLLLKGAVDILLCDGYSGNLVLKTAEGTATYLFQTLKATLTTNLNTKLKALLLKKSLLQLKEKFDYRNYAGAVMIGLEKLVVKTHGGADTKSFYSALKTLHDACQKKVITQFNDLLHHHQQEINKIT